MYISKAFVCVHTLGSTEVRIQSCGTLTDKRTGSTGTCVSQTQAHNKL